VRRSAHGTEDLMSLLLAHLRGPPLPAAERERLREKLIELGEDGSEIGGERRWRRSQLPGVSLRLLRREGGVRLALWRLAPGAAIPPHRHRQDEECLILAGELRQGARRFGAGAFILARAGTRQAAVCAPRGALLLIRGEDDPLLLGDASPPRSVAGFEGIAERRLEALLALAERWGDRLYGLFTLFDPDRAFALCLELLESLWRRPPDPGESEPGGGEEGVIFRRAAALLMKDRSPGPPEPSATLTAAADDALRERLSALSVVQREVLARAVIGRMPPRAIAAALGLPEGTVKSHLHRAARRLRDPRARRRPRLAGPTIPASRPPRETA
jgi:DNA-binding CsgD family transcriptional regulator/quercetin dioxygenase-like cupin family protein